MSLFEKIFKENHESINLYFGNKQNDYEFITLKLTHEKAQNIKNKIKLKNKNNHSSWKQYDVKFRNLIKIEKKYDNGTNEILYLNDSFNDFEILNNNLLIFENKQNINQNSFPSLDTYDSVTKKIYDVYHFDGFDVVFVTQNDEIIIYFNIKNIKKTNEREFNEVIKECS